MIVDTSITVALSSKWSFYLGNQGSEGRREKANQSKKRKDKKRDSIRSRHSRKMA
ncbi:MAG: hypothetical protein ACMUEL_03485 [Flavobacteriales bacterium Tduv]